MTGFFFILDNIGENIPKERIIDKFQKIFGIIREKENEYYVIYAGDV